MLPRTYYRSWLSCGLIGCLLLTLWVSTLTNIQPPAEAAPQVAQQPNTDTVSNPSLDMGLSGLTSNATQLPFIDVFKSSKPWRIEGSDGSKQLTLDLDKDGWLRSMPAPDVKVATMLLDVTPGEFPAGRYVVLYDGAGTLEYAIAGNLLEEESVPGRHIVEVRDDKPRLVIRILDTDPRNTGNYIHNIRVIHEDNLPLYETGEIFNPVWIDKIEDFRSIRFMDWMATNGSPQKTWADRPRPDTARWVGSGVPVEVMIALANKIKADPWFNIPHMANDKYIRNFAKMVEEQLDPDLKAYFELSNEVWNPMFAQSDYAYEQGKARWGKGSSDVKQQWYGMRSAQMADILTDVYGSEADTRLVRVIATRTRFQGVEQPILKAPAWVAEGNDPPYTRFDAYAIAGYFSAELGKVDNIPTVKQWIRNEPDGGFRKALEQLRDGRHFATTALVQDRINTTFVYHGGVAKEYDLDMVVYEGGTHIVGKRGTNSQGEPVNGIDDEELTEFFIALNRHPGMKDLYTILLEGWKEQGGTLFQHFVDVAEPSKYGSWGALAHLYDETPRWEALTDFNANVPAWWENRPDDTFVDGAFVEGNTGDAMLHESTERGGTPDNE